MKILVKSNDLKHNINISLPMGIITMVLKFINISKIKGSSEPIESEILNELFNDYQKENLIKGLKYLKKHHKGLVLVDIESPNGEVVKIQI